MWTKYGLKFQFFDHLVGGVPADPNIQKTWLDSRKPKTRPPDGKSIAEIAEEVANSTLALAEEEEAPKLNIFQRHPDDGYLCVRMSTIRAHIKNMVMVLSSLYVGKVEGERSFSVRAKNAIYYPPEVYWLPILRDGEPLHAPDGQREKPVSMMTRQGKVSAIKVFEFVRRPSLEFELWVLTPPKGRQAISEDDLRTILEYGSVHGYGPERGDGEGKYSFEIQPAAHGEEAWKFTDKHGKDRKRGIDQTA